MNTVLDSYSFEKRRIIVQNVVDNIATDGKTATLEGYLPLEIVDISTKQNIKYEIKYRHRRTAKRRKKYAI